MPTDPTAAMHERIQRARAVQAQTEALQRNAAACAPAGSMNAQQRLIWDIVRAAQMSGALDLTTSEIWQRWCAQSGRAQRNTSVSGRVSELKRMGWLLERQERRVCADSGNVVKAVYIPAHLFNAAPAQGGK